MFACQDGHEQCALELIKAGANVEAHMNSGHTALMLSCQNGHKRCALELIKAGAAVDAVQNTQMTALMYAAEGGHEHCARELLKAGASIANVDFENTSSQRIRWMIETAPRRRQGWRKLRAQWRLQVRLRRDARIGAWAYLFLISMDRDTWISAKKRKIQ